MKAHERIATIHDVPFVGRSRYSLAELALVAAAVATAITWPVNWSLSQILTYLVWLAVLFVLAVLARTDHRTGLIPDLVQARYLLPVTALYVVLSVATSSYTVWDALLGLLIVGVPLYIIFQVSVGHWIGGGGVKLLAITGLLVGVLGSLIVLGIVVLGTISLLAFTKRRSMEIGWLVFAAVVVAKIITAAM